MRQLFTGGNKILHNRFNTNLIEFTYGGFEVESFGETTFAITAPDTDIWLNQKKINSWQSYRVFKGDIIKIGFFKKGVRGYFGVKGGFVDTPKMGSYSASIKEKIKLDFKDNRLYFNNCRDNLKGYLKRKYIPFYPEELTLRTVLSYESNLFKKEDIDRFFNTEFTIKSHNRIGYKLGGSKIDIKDIEIISNPISFGSIQITKDGEPIILLKERQTIGGYPKIGTVVPIDAVLKCGQFFEGC